MAYEIKDKVFFITGAAAGIGAETVRLLVAEDPKCVIVFDVNEKDGIALQNELNSKYGAKVEFIKGDVTKEDEFVGSLEKVKREMGLDVLINNAGIADDSWEMYKKEIEINVISVITGTLHGLTLMRKDKGGTGGTIINMASTAALYQTYFLPVYNATKSAILQFSNCMGKEEYYSKTGVRVLTVCPGRTDTELLNRSHSFDQAIEKTFEEGFKLYPSQKPESVAKGVLEVSKKAIVEVRGL